MNSLPALNTYVEDVFRIKFKKVHLVGFIIQNNQKDLCLVQNPTVLTLI